MAIADTATEGADEGLRPLLVSAHQAARLLGIGRTTLYELIKDQAVTPVHIGRCVRFSVAELEDFVLRRMHAAGRAASVPAVKPAPPNIDRRGRRREQALSLF